MARRKRRSNPRRRRNAIKLNPARRRRSNPRRRRNAGMKLKFDMGSILLGAGLAYYFHNQLKDVLGNFIQPKAKAAGSLSAEEVAALEAQAEAEVAAEDAAAAADMAGMHYGAIHMNPYGMHHMNPSYGAIHLNPAHKMNMGHRMNMGHMRRNMHHM